MGIAVFSVGALQFDADDVLDAAWVRGDLRTGWKRFWRGLAAAQAAPETEPGADDLQAQADALRYRFDLITAEATDAWLEARGLTLEDLTEFCRRCHFVEQSDDRPPRKAPRYQEATAELRELLRQDLLFEGSFDELARQLAWRAAASVEGRQSSRPSGFDGTDSPQWRDAAARVALIGRDEAWLRARFAEEAQFQAECTVACTPEARADRLAALRLPLTRFELDLIDLESIDAVREAVQCLEVDGMTLAELADQEGCRLEHRTLAFEEIAEDARSQYLGAEIGQVLELVTAEPERFQVGVLRAKQEPGLADDWVRGRIDEGLIAAHFDALVARHVVWQWAPNAVA